MSGHAARGRAALVWGVMIAAAGALPAASAPALGQPPDEPLPDPLAAQLGTAENDRGEILDLDIEQLGRVDVVVPALDVEVSTVARQQSTVGRTPAAVFVITEEMIRRSGATCIPEVLRMAPGVDVARVNASTWAISIRGFNSRFANKLLVQVDGRTIYTPTFGGVFWGEREVMLEDVERIEVIRGPGATVWGSNAVNGVINILTKSAQNTQGPMFSGGAGNEERQFTDAYCGGQFAENGYWRISGFQFDHAPGTSPEGFPTDDWQFAKGGFRLDWQLDPDDKLTVEGDYFDSRAGGTFFQQFPDPPYTRIVTEDAPGRGASVLARWTRDRGADRQRAVQLYYDWFCRHTGAVGEDVGTLDFDFQDRFPLAGRHQAIWGFGYRNWQVDTRGSYMSTFVPPDRTIDLFSYFVQDEISLREDLLYLTAGSKFEHSDLSAFEFQPSVRLLYVPDPRRACWAAVSRAVRIPTVTEQDMRTIFLSIPDPPFSPVRAQLRGERSVESEDLLAYEIGYRAQPTEAFSWDLAAFYNRYENLIVYVPGAFPGPFEPAPRIWPWPATNAADAESYGFELTATCRLSESWSVTGSYSYLALFLHARPGVGPEAEWAEGDSPPNQVYFRSSWDLSRRLTLDAILRYVDSLSRGNVPSYVTMDARLAWRPTPHFEAAVVGQNLLDAHHLESPAAEIFSTEVDRGAYGRVTWKY